MFKMPYYKKIITSGSMVEVEVYKSIRRRNLKCIARGHKKQKAQISRKFGTQSRHNAIASV